MNKPNTKATQYEIGKIVWDFGSNTIQSWNGVAWTPVNPLGATPNIQQVLTAGNTSTTPLTFGLSGSTPTLLLSNSGVFYDESVTRNFRIDQISFSHNGNNAQFSLHTTKVTGVSTFAGAQLVDTVTANEISFGTNLFDFNTNFPSLPGFSISDFSTNRLISYSSNGINLRTTTAGAINLLLTVLEAGGNAGNYVLSTESLSTFNVSESTGTPYSSELVGSYGNVIKLANSSAAASADALVPVYSKATLRGLSYIRTITINSGSGSSGTVVSQNIVDGLVTTNTKAIACVASASDGITIDFPTIFAKVTAGNISIEFVKTAAVPNNINYTISVLIQY